MAKRELSSQAAAAALIRKELKAAFPYTTFKVTSSSFSMGDSVDISWTDGPTSAQVEKITRKYQYGDFDGMIDLYEYTNTRDDIPQSKYVQCQRGRSDQTFIAAIEQVNRYYGYDLKWSVNPHGYIQVENDQHTGHDWQSREIHRLIHKTSLVCHACQHPTLLQDDYCGNCGAPLTECEICNGNGQAWDDDIREWTDDPCPTCTGTGFAPIPRRRAAA